METHGCQIDRGQINRRRTNSLLMYAAGRYVVDHAMSNWKELVVSFFLQNDRLPFPFFLVL